MARPRHLRNVRNYRSAGEEGPSTRKRPQPIADVIGELMARRGYAQTMATEQLSDVWGSLVGPLLAAKTRATGVSRGRLEVLVENSVLLQELSFRKHQLLKKMNEKLPELGIKDIRFKVTSL